MVEFIELQFKQFPLDRPNSSDRNLSLNLRKAKKDVCHNWLYCFRQPALAPPGITSSWSGLFSGAGIAVV